MEGYAELELNYWTSNFFCTQDPTFLRMSYKLHYTIVLFSRNNFIFNSHVHIRAVAAGK